MDVIIGVGETGSALKELFKESGRECCGVDLIPDRTFGDLGETIHGVDIIHICLSYSPSFIKDVIEHLQNYSAKAIVIHSTVKPGTTQKLYDELVNSKTTTIFYSPIRGAHSRLLEDLKRYTKFYAGVGFYNDDRFVECFSKQCQIPIMKWSSPLALEVAKNLSDTGFYGWLIIYWQMVDKVCRKLGLDFQEVSSFTDEIHAFFRNRPKMYVDPNGIEGHCILQNLDLIEDYLPELKLIITMINEETKGRFEKLNRRNSRDPSGIRNSNR